MSKNRRLLTATGAGAIAMLIDGYDDFDIKLLTIKLSSAPSSAGSVTVTRDSETGATYDTVLRTVDAVGITSISIENLGGFRNGDKAVVAYANPDSRTWYAEATIEL